MSYRRADGRPDEPFQNNRTPAGAYDDSASIFRAVPVWLSDATNSSDFDAAKEINARDGARIAYACEWDE